MNTLDCQCVRGLGEHQIALSLTSALSLHLSTPTVSVQRTQLIREALLRAKGKCLQVSQVGSESLLLNIEARACEDSLDSRQNSIKAMEAGRQSTLIGSSSIITKRRGFSNMQRH